MAYETIRYEVRAGVAHELRGVDVIQRTVSTAANQASVFGAGGRQRGIGRPPRLIQQQPHLLWVDLEHVGEQGCSSSQANLQGKRQCRACRCPGLWPQRWGFRSHLIALPCASGQPGNGVAWTERARNAPQRLEVAGRTQRVRRYDVCIRIGEEKPQRGAESIEAIGDVWLSLSIW